MSRPGQDPEEGLVHVVVCGGTPAEWSLMSADDWATRFGTIARGVSGVGVRWVTLFPHHGAPDGSTTVAEALTAVPNVSGIPAPGGDRWLWRRDDRLAVVVDTCPDGHSRFARVVESLRASSPGFDEDALSLALTAPVGEPADLVLILGPPDELPASLVWELSYSELVFLDIAWGGLQPVHLEMAIDDFNRRHRRFGGLDS